MGTPQVRPGDLGTFDVGSIIIVKVIPTVYVVIQWGPFATCRHASGRLSSGLMHIR